MNVDETTGEVVDTEQQALVPLDLHRLSEDELAQMMPSPAQVAGAMLIARERIARAPKVLEELSGALKAAKRDLRVATALAFGRYRDEGWSVGDARALATSDEKVQAAQAAADEAELKLEYGRDLRKTLTEDVELLRSLNANYRAEAGR